MNIKLMKEMDARGGPGQKLDPEMGAKSYSKMVPFRGGRMSENTMNSKGFGSKPALRGDHFGLIFGARNGSISGPPIFRNLQEFN